MNALLRRMCFSFSLLKGFCLFDALCREPETLSPVRFCSFFLRSISQAPPLLQGLPENPDCSLNGAWVCILWPCVFGCWGSSLNVFSVCLGFLNCNCRRRRIRWAEGQEDDVDVFGCWLQVDGGAKISLLILHLDRLFQAAEANPSFPLILIMSMVIAHSNALRAGKSLAVFENTSCS